MGISGPRTAAESSSLRKYVSIIGPYGRQANAIVSRDSGVQLQACTDMSYSVRITWNYV